MHLRASYITCNNQLMRKQEFLERVIRRFIPPPILYVCEAEESGWFAEIGRVAVIFVNIAIKGLPGMDVMQSVFLVSRFTDERPAKYVPPLFLLTWNAYLGLVAAGRTSFCSVRSNTSEWFNASSPVITLPSFVMSYR